jgi:succinate dehydrogenase flavoprotein subunit
LLVEDALTRQESCGCHFNVAYQTEDHEALRDDESCCNVVLWSFNGVGKKETRLEEPLIFENVELAQRSYK